MKTKILLSVLVVFFTVLSTQRSYSQLSQDYTYFEFFSNCIVPVNVEIELKTKNLLTGMPSTSTYSTTIMPGGNKLMDFETNTHTLVYDANVRIVHSYTGITEVSYNDHFPVTILNDRWSFKVNKKHTNTYCHNNYYAFNLTDGFNK